MAREKKTRNQQGNRQPTERTDLKKEENKRARTYKLKKPSNFRSSVLDFSLYLLK